MSREATRLVSIGAAMSRYVGLQRGAIAFRQNPEHIAASHDILDAVRANPIAEGFLDWLLELAEEDFDRAADTDPPA